MVLVRPHPYGGVGENGPETSERIEKRTEGESGREDQRSIIGQQENFVHLSPVERRVLRFPKDRTSFPSGSRTGTGRPRTY